MALTVCAISDVHLEVNLELDFSKKKFADADILVILGDFFPAGYLQYLSKDCVGQAAIVKKKIDYLRREVFPKYMHVFFILGNHDFYHTIYSEVFRMYNDFFSDVPNLRVLQNDFFMVDETCFLGSSFWTDCNNCNPLDLLAIQFGMPDYQHMFRWTLPDGHTYVDPYYLVERHWESKKFIDDVSYHTEKVVVMTHHAPSFKCLDPSYKGSLNYAFASDLDEWLLEKTNITHWFHGHTHYNTDFMIGNTRIYSNQCGYQGREPKKYENFDPSQLIKL